MNNKRKLLTSLIGRGALEGTVLYIVSSTILLYILSFIFWDHTYILQGILFWTPASSVAVTLVRVITVISCIIFEVKQMHDIYLDRVNGGDE